VTRRPRRAGAERPGVEEAEIVEILDHHHIGSIETASGPGDVRPVGSTATLVIERFRQNGWSRAVRPRSCATGAILSDTIILNSPTTTERDHAVIEYLERVLALDAEEFGREMFEETSDTSDIPARSCRLRRQGVLGQRRPHGGHAQVETSGRGCWSAATSCSRRCAPRRSARTTRSTP
jgi:manganese-dependent inorganic pyrophosphatase